MAYIKTYKYKEIEFDLDDFDDDQIVYGATVILKDKRRSGDVKSELIKELKQALAVKKELLPEGKSLADVYKIELLNEAFQKYTLEQLQLLLK